MAEFKGTTVGILVRIGTGEPVEVAEIEVPMRARLARDKLAYSNGRTEVSAFIEVDWEALNDGVRSALAAVAEEVPVFGPTEEKTDE